MEQWQDRKRPGEMPAEDLQRTQDYNQRPGNMEQEEVPNVDSSDEELKNSGG